MAPFVNNIKLVYRDLFRMQVTWDQKVPEKIEERIVEALSFFFKMEKIRFHRKAVFSAAATRVD